MNEASQPPGLGHQPQPVAGDAIAGFHVWLRDTRRRNSCEFGDLKPSGSQDGLGFVTESELRRFMTEAVLTAILRQLFPKGPPSYGPRDIMRHCLRSFATLLSIDRGRFFEQFLRSAELRDTFPLHLKPRSWPASDNDPFWDEFYRTQWTFCPIELEQHSRIDYSETDVLPFLEKILLDRGSSAKVYAVKVHKDCDRLRDSLSRDHRTYVLKTYSGMYAKTYFDIETENYTRLVSAAEGKDPPGIVPFLCAFTHAGTYNLMTEQATGGSLKSYLDNSPPPTEGSASLIIWTAFQEAMKGLRRIHDLEFSHETQFHGLHADVKPSNILLMSDPSTKDFVFPFKMCLGDLGLCDFVEASGGDREEEVLNMVGGQVYSAPESYQSAESERRCKTRITQKVDVWSMGCTILVLATWIIHGIDGVKRFREARKAENDANRSKAGERFHDGTLPSIAHLSSRAAVFPGRLKCVETQLKELPKDIRKADKITGRMLEMADWMIRSSPDSRPSIQGCVEKLASYIDDARARTRGDRQQQSSSDTSGYSIGVAGSLGNSGGAFREQYQGIVARSGRAGPSRHSQPAYSGTENFKEPLFLSETDVVASPQTTLIGDAAISARLGKGRSTGPYSVAQQDWPETGGPYERHSLSESQLPRSSGLPHVQFDPTPKRFASLGGYKGGSDRLGMNDISEALEGSSPAPRRVQSTQSAMRPTTEPERTRTWTSATQDRDFEVNASMSKGKSKMTEDPLEPSIGMVDPEAEPSSAVGRSSGFQTAGPSKTPASALKTNREIPSLSREVALHWKHDMKDWNHPSNAIGRLRNSGKAKPTLPRMNLLEELRGRDHIFLLDDALCMEEHWEDVLSTLDILAYIVKEFDDDGMDLYFTVSTKIIENSRHSTNLRKAVAAHRPKGKTDINVRLSSILGKCRQAICDQEHPSGPNRNREYRKRAKPVSIYVLSNGLWEKGKNAEQPIMNMIEALNEQSYTRKQVGIQFIRFGEIPECITRLHGLDDMSEKPEAGNLDIVDTEYWKGNVFKMLLGPINEIFDSA